MSSTEIPIEEAVPGQAARARRARTLRDKRSFLPALGLNLIALAVGVGAWALLARAGVQALPGPVAVADRAA